MDERNQAYTESKASEVIDIGSKKYIINEFFPQCGMPIEELWHSHILSRIEKNTP